MLVLKHNPELIPLTRVILNENDVSSASSSSSPLSQSFSPNTSSYNSPFNSTKALNEVDVLTPTEIEYVKMRAQIDAQKLKSIPESFEVTSRMKMVYEKFKEAAAFLSNEIDPHTPFNMDAITSCSPILLGEDKDIQLFVLATNSDLVLSEHVEEEEKSKRSYFDRLFKKQAISPPPANNTNNRVVEHNVKYFQFENLNLFEALHHNAYNFTNYSNYRREMESLSVKNISSVTKVNQKQKQEQRNVLIELKRKWDLNNSWISQIIEAHKYNQK